MLSDKVPDTPVEVIVDLLTKAKGIASACATVPEELKSHLQKALDIASGLDNYLEKIATKESEPLAELYRKTMSHNWDQVFEEGKTKFRLPKECITGHVEGQTLKMLIHMSQAKRVLEIGMFTGYGALSMAEGLPEDGCLVACELEPYLKEFSQPIFEKSPHGKKITVKVGSAMETLQVTSGPIILIHAGHSDEEKEQLRKFTNRSFLLDKTSRCQAWLSLLDILLAYSYEVRCAEGEHNVESPWTIRKLSGTLCWLETYSCSRDVLVSFGRRVLCYPLYRHFALLASSICDTAKILQSGKACVLKCLLNIHKIFRENDPAYILNDLYITDYCIWIQRVSSKKMLELATMLQHTPLQKKDLELELDELESAARMVVEEEKQASTESSSSDSSSESEESEAEEQGCSDSKQGGGETCKVSPSQPNSSPSSPIPHLSSSALSPSVNRKAGAVSSDSQGCGQLIQELGRQMVEELRISADSYSFGAGETFAAAEAEEPPGCSSSCSSGTVRGESLQNLPANHSDVPRLQ